MLCFKAFKSGFKCANSISFSRYMATKQVVKSNVPFYTSGWLMIACLFGSMYYEYYNTREKQMIVNTLLDTSKRVKIDRSNTGRRSRIPEAATNLYDRALVLAELEEYDQSLEVVDQLIEKFPNFSQGYTLKARILFRSLNYDTFADGNRIDTYPLVAVSYASNALHNDQKIHTILSCTNSVVDGPISDIFKEAVTIRGTALLLLDRYEEALYQYNKILQFDSQNVEVQLLKGATFIKMKKFDEAIEVFGNVLSKDPENEHALHGLRAARITREHKISRIDKPIL